MAFPTNSSRADVQPLCLHIVEFRSKVKLSVQNATRRRSSECLAQYIPNHLPRPILPCKRTILPEKEKHDRFFSRVSKHKVGTTFGDTKTLFQTLMRAALASTEETLGWPKHVSGSRGKS